MVENIFERSTNEFIKLYFAKYSVICTFEHPFIVNNLLEAAKDLKLGDSLFAYSGYKVAIDSIYTFRTDTAPAVYNLEADGNHNLFNRSDPNYDSGSYELEAKQFGNIIRY